MIADIFMEDLEEKASGTSEEPCLWRRFVDNVIAIVTKETGKKLLQHLNSQHPQIKFTLDKEEGCLPFMDVSFTCQLDGSLTSVPETNTHQQIRLVQLSPPNEGEGRHRSRFSGPCDKGVQ